MDKVEQQLYDDYKFELSELLEVKTKLNSKNIQCPITDARIYKVKEIIHEIEKRL